MANAYPELVAAARSLPDAGEMYLEDEGQLSDERIAAFVQESQSGLAAARRALARRCSVPLEYTRDFYSKHADDVFPMRNLACAFALEFILAGRNKRFADAVEIGLSILHLAIAVRRGGLMTDLLISVAFEGIGIDRLRRVRRALTTDQCIRLSAELMRVDDEREPFDDILARDSEWEEKAGLSDEEADARAPYVPQNEVEEAAIAAMRVFAALPEGQQRSLQRQIDDRGAALLRLLAVESALRAYHCVSGGYPDGLPELVPDFIKKVPLDPYADQAFRYRTEDGGFVLYSVGPSGTDSGGRFGSWLDVEFGGADLCLDASDFDEG